MTYRGGMRLWGGGYYYVLIIWDYEKDIFVFDGGDGCAAAGVRCEEG